MFKYTYFVTIFTFAFLTSTSIRAQQENSHVSVPCSEEETETSGETVICPKSLIGRKIESEDQLIGCKTDEWFSGKANFSLVQHCASFSGAHGFDGPADVKLNLDFVVHSVKMSAHFDGSAKKAKEKYASVQSELVKSCEGLKSASGEAQPFRFVCGEFQISIYQNGNDVSIVYSKEDLEERSGNE